MDRIKYSDKELELRGFYEPEWIGSQSMQIFSTPVTPRENYLAFLRHEKPLWMPMTTDTRVFNPRILPDNVARAWVQDVDGLKPGEEGGRDMFGILWRYVPSVQGSMVEPGKPILKDANDWMNVIKFPDIDSYDWEGCADRNRGVYFDTPRATFMWIFSGLFERLISFMDFENAIYALVDEDQKDAVHALFSRLCDMYEDLIDHYVKYFHVDVIHFHDDWGNQRAPMFSLNTCLEMIAPYIKRVVEHCHKHGVYFDFHCCGKVEQLVPAMIECGIDVWAGQELNDVDMLIDKYGDKLIFGLSPSAVQMDASDDAAIRSGRDFVDKYAPLMGSKPVWTVMRRCHLKQREAVYKFSRIALNGEAD
jgi:hypothetical protein